MGENSKSEYINSLMRRAVELWDRENAEKFRSFIVGIAEAICVIENLKFDTSEEPYKIEKKLDGA